MRAEGLALEDVLGGRGGKKTRGTVAPKYRNPADPGQQWSGRGRQPVWFAAAIKAGKKEKDLLIK